MTDEQRILVHALVRLLRETLDLDDEDLKYMTVGDAVAEIGRRGELPEHPEHFGRAIDLVAASMLMAEASRVTLPEHHVRWHMARHKSTLADALAALARDGNRHVRRDVAQNTSTPADVLVALAVDEDDDVRRFVAYNTSTPAYVLVDLARDAHGDVRQGVAENTSTPADVLEALALAADWGVHNSARESLVVRRGQR